jgi:hypothetical protein
MTPGGKLVCELEKHGMIDLNVGNGGAHSPHIARIPSQSRFGAQSVALSGGYEDDEDHKDWFLYTGRFDNLTTNHLFTVFFCLVTNKFHYIKMCIK